MRKVSESAIFNFKLLPVFARKLQKICMLRDVQKLCTMQNV
jgi:hypothetical protein